MGLSTSKLLKDPHSFATPADNEKPRAYDYVIVGGGTAGCVVANRLSENPNVSVLVIEAGGLPPLESRAPIAFSKLFHNQTYDWDFYTTPQKDVDGREQYWPRAKLLGGCSSMNAMMAHQAAPSDYDEWAQVHGCDGWSYADLKPYFRRMEGFTANPNRPAVDLSHRGQEGFVRTGYSWLTEIGEKGFLGACEAVGIPYNADLNTAAGSEGASRIISYIDSKGARSSTATAYLHNGVLARPNLTVAIETRVTRILFDEASGSQPLATGVELQCVENGPLFRVKVNKEVLVCTGAVQTPQALMLSGIGPKAQLEQHGIKVLVDQPHVGEHLKDHFVTSPILAKARPGTTLDYLGSDIKALPSLVRWLLFGTGPFTSNVGEVAAFVRSNDESLPYTHGLSGPADRKSKFHGSLGKGPDLEFIGTPMAYYEHGAPPHPTGMTDTFTIAPIGLRPQSEGTITLKSKSVWDKVIIDPRYWSDPNDLQVLVEGVRLALAILHSAPMQQYLDPNAPKSNDVNNVYWPYSADPKTITDDQIRSWAGKHSFTLYHPVCTARMGKDPKTSVISSDTLKVHGLQNVRVVDASIFPEQIAGHPTAAIIACAEKASDIIRGVRPAIDGKGVVPVNGRESHI